ncbi:50S ribosomal protein L9 [bacterium]|nr:50S ribosomal protein L9 [bacterium]
MKVILTDDLENLGKRGEVKEVATGYGRNFLIPKGMAYPATAANLKKLEKEQLFEATATEKKIKGTKETAGRIEKLTLTIARQAGEEDKLFGSVTSSDLADLLKEEGIQVDKKKIILEKPIKALGEYQVPIKLGDGVETRIKIKLVKEDKEE